MRGALLMLVVLWLPFLGCGKASEQAAQPSEKNVVPVDTTPQTDPYTLYTYAERRGKRLFQKYCTVCHGDSGQGDGFNSYNLDPRPHDLSDVEYMLAISDQSLREVIAQGGRGVNKSILMPAYGHTLPQRDIDDLVAFIRTLSKRRADQALAESSPAATEDDR